MKNSYENFISSIGNTPLIKLKAASEITGCNIMEKLNILTLEDQSKIEQP